MDETIKAINPSPRLRNSRSTQSIPHPLLFASLQGLRRSWSTPTRNACGIYDLLRGEGLKKCSNVKVIRNKIAGLKPARRKSVAGLQPCILKENYYPLLCGIKPMRRAAKEAVFKDCSQTLPGPSRTLRNKPSPPKKILVKPLTVSTSYLTSASKKAILPVSTLCVARVEGRFPQLNHPAQGKRCLHR